MSVTTLSTDLTAGGGECGAGAGAGGGGGGGGGDTSSAGCHRDGGAGWERGAGRAGRPPFHEYHPPSALRPGSGPAVRDAARGGTYLAAADWGWEETAAAEVERGGGGEGGFSGSGHSSRVGGKGGGSATAPWPGSGGE
jgi:hypothetical protein